MRAYDAVKSPWLTIPVVGGFFLAFLPVIFATKEGANQYKDDVIKTTYQRSDGSRYTETRGSFAPGMILLVGIGILVAVAIAIYNFMENAEDSLELALVFSVTQLALFFALAKRKLLLEVAETKSSKEGTGWLVWVLLLLTLAWPWTDIAPLFEVKPNNLPYLYIPLTIFLFLGFVVPLLAAFQIFYLLLFSKSYWSILFTVLFIYLIKELHGMEVDGTGISRLLLPMLVNCIWPAIIIMSNIKMWQCVFSEKTSFATKTIFSILGSITGFALLFGGLSLLLYINFYENNGYNELSYFFVKQTEKIGTELIIYPPLICLLLVSLYSFYSTLKNKNISKRGMKVINGFNALAVLPILVFGFATTIEASKYIELIEESKIKGEYRVFVKVYKRPEDVSSKNILYIPLLVSENLFSSTKISMSSSTAKDAMKVETYSSGDKTVISVKVQDKKSEKVDIISVQGVRKHLEDVGFYPSLPEGTQTLRVERNGEVSLESFDVGKRRSRYGFFSKKIRFK